MGQTTTDWTLSKVHGAPLHADEDGYGSLVIAATTTPAHEVLARNTVYSITANGADVHIVLLSEKDIITDSIDVSVSNSMFIHDGERVWITTKTAKRAEQAPEGLKEEKTILAVRTATGTGNLHVTLMSSRAGR